MFFVEQLVSVVCGMCGRFEIFESVRHFRIESRIGTSNSHSNRMSKLRRSLEALATLAYGTPFLHTSVYTKQHGRLRAVLLRTKLITTASARDGDHRSKTCERLEGRTLAQTTN